MWAREVWANARPAAFPDAPEDGVDRTTAADHLPASPRQAACSPGVRHSSTHKPRPTLWPASLSLRQRTSSLGDHARLQWIAVDHNAGVAEAANHSRDL